MKLMKLISTKDPRRKTFEHKQAPLLKDVERARQAVNFMRGVIEDALEAETLTDEQFDLLEYMRLVMSSNLDDVIDKSNWFVIEANRVLGEKETFG